MLGKIFFFFIRSEGPSIFPFVALPNSLECQGVLQLFWGELLLGPHSVTQLYLLSTPGEVTGFLE